MSVRVLRADGRIKAPRARDFAPSAHRIDAARWEARVEAEKTIAAARDDAEAIIAAARANAESISAEATRVGRERAHAEVAVLLAAARAESAATAERALELVVTATRAVAERAIGSALAVDNAALTGWAREALATFAGARRIVLRAHPRTIERLSPHVRELGHALELMGDPELTEDTLTIRTDLGDARIELHSQVEAFVHAIRDVLARELRARHG